MPSKSYSELFVPGYEKRYSFTVTEADLAMFNGILIHKVCSTFALAREAELAGRLLLIDFLQPGDEGIGTMLEIRHLAPAFQGSLVEITASVYSLQANELVCFFRAISGKKVVAEGKTGQKIISKEKLAILISPK